MEQKKVVYKIMAAYGPSAIIVNGNSFLFFDCNKQGELLFSQTNSVGQYYKYIHNNTLFYSRQEQQHRDS